MFICKSYFTQRVICSFSLIRMCTIIFHVQNCVSLFLSLTSTFSFITAKQIQKQYYCFYEDRRNSQIL